MHLLAKGPQHISFIMLNTPERALIKGGSNEKSASQKKRSQKLQVVLQKNVEKEKRMFFMDTKICYSVL